MKKAGVLLIVLLVVTIPLVAAFFHNDDEGGEGTTQDPDAPSPTNLPGNIPSGTADDAYQCLENLIDEKEENSLSLQEAVFSTLALGSDSKLNNVINSFTDNNECWPESSCNVKDTAQVLLAQDRIHKNTDDIESWLLDQTGLATELVWYLQIDISNHEEATCTLNYQDSDRTITIKDDMTLTGGPGSCLAISQSGFWLRVNNNCVDETFRVSCDQDFITNLLYQRTGSSTIYVSPNTHSQAALGTTEETVNSQCFKKGTTCDYEGSAWAALALDKAGNEVNSYLPYLLALAEENKRLFPNAFIHVITQGDDQYSTIVQSQQQNQYWQAPNTLYNRFYDTALALISLQGTGAQEFSNAQDYLLQIQTPEGCWNSNNIRDTAFLLYAGWPNTISNPSSSVPASCASQGFGCISSLFTCTDIGGSVLDLDCDFGVCCSVSLQPLTCIEQNGIVCTASQTCSGTTVDSLDGSCCLGSCQELPQANECELVGGGCFTSCTEDEEQLSDSCPDSSLVCCKVKTATDEGGLSIWLWIVLLLILIAIIVLAIIYRKKIQMQWYKIKNRKKGKGKPSTGAPPRRPGAPPPGMRFASRRRPMMRRPGAPPIRGGPMQRVMIVKESKEDKEFEDTLNKLKKMSK